MAALGKKGKTFEYFLTLSKILTACGNFKGLLFYAQSRKF